MDDPTTAGVTEGFGLMFYNARWYDPALGRFAQADTIVPAGVQGLDRYAYVGNNPINYNDPSGHVHCDEEGNCFGGNPWENKPSQGGLPSGKSEGGGDEDEDDNGSLLDLVNDGFDKSECENTLYRCEGNNATGYVFDPITGDIVTWNNGTDFAVLSTMNSENNTLTTNLSLFMNETDEYFSSAEAAAWAVGGAGATGVIFVAGVYSGAYANPFGALLLLADGVGFLASAGFAIYSYNEMNENRENINTLYTGILLNTPYTP
jgi:RHS repeat-associated protein